MVNILYLEEIVGFGLYEFVWIGIICVLMDFEDMELVR